MMQYDLYALQWCTGSGFLRAARRYVRAKQLREEYFKMVDLK